MKKLTFLASICVFFVGKSMDFEFGNFDTFASNLGAKKVEENYLYAPRVGVFHPYNFDWQNVSAYRIDGDSVKGIAAGIGQMSDVKPEEYDRIKTVFLSIQTYDKGFNPANEQDKSAQPLLFRPHRIYANFCGWSSGIAAMVRVVDFDDQYRQELYWEELSIHGQRDDEKKEIYGTLSPDRMEISNLCPNDGQYRLIFYWTCQEDFTNPYAGITIMCPNEKFGNVPVKFLNQISNLIR
jgi:hypothetical protein